MRDFLNGLDNLHEYLRFSYRGMRAPSFFVESESKDGLTLHYRTRRRGYTHYVMVSALTERRGRGGERVGGRERGG